eukprot:2155858-Pleurochrysis_carterae.AAC.7
MALVAIAVESTGTATAPKILKAQCQGHRRPRFAHSRSSAGNKRQRCRRRSLRARWRCCHLVLCSHLRMGLAHARCQLQSRFCHATTPPCERDYFSRFHSKLQQ